MSTLTDRQRADCRRWMGYPLLQPNEHDYVYGKTPSSVSLDDRLDSISAIEEEILTDTFLTPIALLETDIVDMRDNMDTTKAGPWEANARELGDRNALFRQKRRELCAFLGYAPGPALSAGGSSMALVRC